MTRSQLQPGDIIGGIFEVIDLAGVGATSYVYHCRTWDRDGAESVAVKVLHGHLMDNRGARDRFLREARLMRGLSHPNIVRVYDILELESVIAYSMDLIDGPCLNEWADGKNERGETEQVLALFMQVLSGIACTHQAGIIHRDLKPGNIMVDLSQRAPVAKIIDFGIAREHAAGPDAEEFHTIRGTAGYISPDEIRSPNEVCISSDIYSLGCVLYELTAGVRPFQDRPPGELLKAHLHERPELPSAHNPHVHPAVESVILGMLAKHPADRYACAEELRSSLTAAMELAEAIHVEPPAEVLLATLRPSWLSAVQTAVASFVSMVLYSGLREGAEDVSIAVPPFEIPGMM
jgi:serine/threonine-protein kinase